MKTKLYYIHDPMCSWCWGYRPVWSQLKNSLPDSIELEYVAGGLAPDNDNPMPQDMQQRLQGAWRKIADLLGTEFNFDFWTQNTPRRSTYIACRAVIAAKKQNVELEMVEAIQRAYYLQALNPSDTDILMRLAWDLYAKELDVDLDQFANDLTSVETQHELERQIALAGSLSDKGFPSLVLEHNGEQHFIQHDYKDHTPTLKIIEAIIQGDYAQTL
jgi:putative protein-disulfide isomerase